MKIYHRSLRGLQRSVQALLAAVLFLALITGQSVVQADGISASDQSAPVILITDLNHPYGDPDDHIDVAVAAGLKLNVVGLVLEVANGVGPASQIASIAGTNWPTVVGPDSGATLILDTLTRSSSKITIVAVGGLSTIAKAWDANPDLLRQKVKNIVVYAGDAADMAPVEYNVSLDVRSYLTVMSSELPIRWVPCFDGGLWQAGTRSSFVQTENRVFFPTTLDDRLEKVFSYRLLSSTVDPLTWISQPVNAADRSVLDNELRNVWAAGQMVDAIGDGVLTWNGATVGEFVPITTRLNTQGQVDPTGSITIHVNQWVVRNPGAWREAMIGLTVKALHQVGNNYGYNPIQPTRIADTRDSGQMVQAGAVTMFSIPPEVVPANANAVTINLTNDQGQGYGYLTALPCNVPVQLPPNTSSLNFDPVRSTANQATVAISNRQVCVYSTTKTHVIIDVAGYFANKDGATMFTPLPVVRVYDSRDGQPQSNVLPARSVKKIDFSGIVSPNAKAVTFNLTSTDGRDYGFLTAYPCYSMYDSVPNASNVNTIPFEDRPNQVTTSLNQAKSICVYTESQADFLIDIYGEWVPTDGRAIAFNSPPTRMMDTRNGRAFKYHEIRQIYPERNEVVWANLTVDRATAPGFGSVFRCNDGYLNTSSVNYLPNKAIANAITIDASAGGICLYAESPADFIFDIAGTR